MSVCALLLSRHALVVDSVRALFLRWDLPSLPVVPLRLDRECRSCGHIFLPGREVPDVYGLSPWMFSPSCSLSLPAGVEAALRTASTLLSLEHFEGASSPVLSDLLSFPAARISPPFEFCSDGSRLYDRVECRLRALILAQGPATERYLSRYRALCSPGAGEVLVLYRGGGSLQYDARILALSFGELGRFYLSPTTLSTVLLRLPRALLDAAVEFRDLGYAAQCLVDVAGRPFLDAGAVVASVPAPILSPAGVEVLVGLLPELGLAKAAAAATALEPAL